MFVRAENPLSILKENPILLDGAMGTNLMASRMPMGCCAEEWMLAHKDVVMGIQRRYAEAGSQIIYAPTFTAQPSRLKRHGLDAQTERINERLVQMTRKAAQDCLIAGSMTTLAGVINTRDETCFEEMVCAYRRQIKGIKTGGADLIVGETLLSSRDARAILLAAKEEQAGSVMLSFALREDGKLRSGEDARNVFEMFKQEGLLALGVNCVSADDALPMLIQRLRSYTSLPLICKPNAGRPIRQQNGTHTYPVGAHRFAYILSRCVDVGANLIGGCCGTTPETIAAVAQRIHCADKGR
jgi:5-methyltetrahydrofolate--homocysteine methyltransferase